MTDKSNRPPTNKVLEGLFAEAKADAPPAPDLVARVLADAEAVQLARTLTVAPRPRPRRRAAWRGLFGGWAGISAALAASAAGVMIGITSPDLVDGATGGRLFELTGAGLWTDGVAYDPLSFVAALEANP